MCPMRFLLVFFSAMLAAYFAWRTVRSSPEDEKIDFDDCTDENVSSSEAKQEYGRMKMVQNGFWVFVDMASGRYLWRNLKEIKKNENVKSS